jgi:hypothetical protein
MLKTQEEILTMCMLLDATYVGLGGYFVKRSDWREKRAVEYFDLSGNPISKEDADQKYWDGVRAGRG